MTEVTRGPAAAGGGRMTGGRACMATALAAAALLVGAANQAAAQTPEPNHLWTGCVLDPTTVADLVADLHQEGAGVGTEGADPEVAFILVYSLNNQNDGQPVSGGLTGPVLCKNEALVGTEATTQTTPIPETGTANFLGTEDVFIVQYELNDESEPPTIEKVLCHSAASNTDCVRISPDLAP